MATQLPADITAAIDRTSKFAGLYGLARASDRTMFGRLYDEARAELDAAIAGRLDAWLPIESAPKGRDAKGKVQYVLLIAPYPGTDHWSDIRQGWYCDHTDTWERWPHRFAPTHWRPSPPPPVPDQAEEGRGE